MKGVRQGFVEPFGVERLLNRGGTNVRPMSTERVPIPEGASGESLALGDRPIDAAYRAIDSGGTVAGELKDLVIHTLTGSMDVLGAVMARLRGAGTLNSCRCADIDIAAVAKANAFAFNRLATTGAAPRVAPEGMRVAATGSGDGR